MMMALFGLAPTLEKYAALIQTNASVSNFSRMNGMPSAPFTYLTIGPEADVYVSTLGGGLAVFYGSSWQTMEVAGELTASNQIRDLAESVDGFVWIANDLGVQQMSPADPAIQRLYTLGMAAFPSMMYEYWRRTRAASGLAVWARPILMEATGKSSCRWTD